MSNNNYMTNEEFEAYLKSIGGLENGWFSDRDPIVSRGFCSCGNGWLGIIKNLIDDLIKLGWDKQILQIKEKFGGLRFYTNGLPESGHELIMKAMDKSCEVCEECGEPGRVISGSWIRTLCPTHNPEGRPGFKLQTGDEVFDELKKKQNEEEG